MAQSARSSKHFEAQQEYSPPLIDVAKRVRKKSSYTANDADRLTSAHSLDFGFLFFLAFFEKACYNVHMNILERIVYEH